MYKSKENNLRNLFILLGSTLSVMQGALISPALTHIANHFTNEENIVFLSKLIIAIPPIFIVLFSPLAGVLFDKYGRKSVLIISAILYGVSGSSGYFADNIYLILIGRAFLGVAISGLMTGFIILIGDLFAGKEKFNKFIGIQGAFMSFGGVVYLLSGEYLANLSWNVPFLGYLTSIIVAVGLLAFLSETKTINKADSAQINSKSIHVSRKFLKIHLLALFLMIAYLMVPTQIPFLLLQYPELDGKYAGIFLAIWILFSSIASLAYSRIRNYLDYKQSFALAFLFWSLGYFIIYFASSYVVVLIALILSGIGNGVAIPNIKAQLLEYAGISNRSKQSGFLSMSLYLGQFLSPIIVEPIIKISTPQMPFLVFAIVMIVIAVTIYLQKR